MKPYDCIHPRNLGASCTLLSISHDQSVSQSDDVIDESRAEGTGQRSNESRDSAPPCHPLRSRIFLEIKKSLRNGSTVIQSCLGGLSQRLRLSSGCLQTSTTLGVTVRRRSRFCITVE